MELFKLEKPDLSDISKERLGGGLLENQKELVDMVSTTISPKYLYWDKVKYKQMPEGITPKEFWYLVKIIRGTQLTKSLIKHENGAFFSWIKLPTLEANLHKIDMKLGGRLLHAPKDIDEQKKAQFVSRGILEEAIASSQLEGAATSRKAAKAMIREGRKPKNNSEQMILNNYNTIQLIEDDFKKRDLNEGMLLELHRILTEGTDVPSNEQGRFRTDNDEIIVRGKNNDFIYHITPKENFLRKELPRLIAFANDDESMSQEFTHPVIKAIMIHFWVGYLHPFTDGNGRMARAFFYWYLLKHGYWAVPYLPISTVIKRAPKRYMMAYVYSEQDDADLTYFLDYHIDRINLSMLEFDEYADRVSLGNKKMMKLSRSRYNFNLRQVQTLQYLSEDKDAQTTLRAHQNINQISRMTAYKDLKALEGFGFLRAQKRGRRVYYRGTEKIQKLFEG